MSLETFDVLVIGSGLGGMCSAALLAKNGIRPLVVEKLNFIGGRCSTMVMNGFKIPTGAMYFQESGDVLKILNELNITDIPFRPLPGFYVKLKSRIYELPEDGYLESVFTLLENEDKNNREAIIGIAKKIASEKILLAFGQAVANPEKVTAFTLRDWLLQFTGHNDVHKIFDIISMGFVGAHSYEIPARNFFEFVAYMKAMRDMVIPVNGAIEIMKALENFIKQAGGDIWLNSPAKSILIEKGATQGVVVKHNGKDMTIRCKAVISNSGPIHTIELAGYGNFDDEYHRMVRMRMRSRGLVMFHVASSRPLMLENGETGFVMMPHTRRLIYANPYTNATPEWAPEGQHLTGFLGFPQLSIFPMDRDYEMELCMEDLRELVPDLDNVGRIIHTHAPNVESDFVDLRNWVGYGLPKETPVKGLYNVGDCVQPPGITGTSAVAESALYVMNILKREL